MVEPRCGGLDPAEAALPHDLLPGHGNFCVTAKNIGREQFSIDAFLPGIDHFGVRNGSFDLRDMLRTDRITKDNPGRSGRIRCGSNRWR